MSEIVEAISALGTATEGLKAAKESFEEVRKDADQAINDVNANFTEKAASLTITANAGYRNAVEKASGGRNTMIIDAQGNENIMVVIPRFNVEDLGLDSLNLGTGTHPAFKTNGVARGEILVGKYLASPSLGGGSAVVGGVQPRGSWDYDQSKVSCLAKGENWHMMSVHEWAAIALWSLANGTIPRGNTNYGRSHEKKWEAAIRDDGGVPGDSAGAARSSTGSGPESWGHDHGAFGVQDLVGNVWEWIDQMRLENGQIITTLDNDPSIAEVNWFKHAAYFDSLSDIQVGNAGSPVFNSTIENRNGVMGDGSNVAYTNNGLFSSITKDVSYVENELLRRLLIESAADAGLAGAVYVRNYGERFPSRGGGWYNGSGAGLGALALDSTRTEVSSIIGFRPAYFV